MLHFLAIKKSWRLYLQRGIFWCSVIVRYMNAPGSTLNPTAAPPAAIKPVKVIHKRIDQYRNIPMDGVWGMINANGAIQLELYLEKPPVPSTLVYPVVSSPEGPRIDATFKEAYAENEKRDTHFIVIREFQAGVVMSLSAAIQLHHVL